MHFKSPTEAVVKSELYQNVLRLARKISPNAEVLQCYFYRKQYGIPGFRKYGRVHFKCCVTLGMMQPDYLEINDNKVEIFGNKYREELLKLSEMILDTRRISNTCLLCLAHEDDVTISDVGFMKNDNGFVID